MADAPGTPNASSRTPTGIPGLDKLLTGGLPKSRIILLSGGPGTGKTILSSQYLVNGILDYEESGVYVSLDENKQHVFEEMLDFGWDFEDLENNKKLIFLEASPIRYLPAEIKVGKLTVGRKEFSMATLIEMIKTSVREIGAKRIVVDPVTTLVFQYEGVAAQRNALVELMEALADTGATCLITTELRRPGFERSIDYEEYLAHGVILLQQLQVGKSLLRVIQVEKMRKTPLDNQPRPYRITDTGIEVFPRESVL
jgi:KaiC/GvpD/RAD55 family RecA-like ATPase